MAREKLFSVTGDDCEFEYFRSSGAGGQHRDKTSSACRCRHIASGAVAEARDAREQPVNKRNAFLRMIETPVFKTWLRLETARVAMHKASIQQMIDDYVEEATQPNKIKVESVDEKGKWVRNKTL